MKKLFRNSVLIGVLYYLLVLVNACCHCEPTRNRFFTTEGINGRNIEFKFVGDTIFEYHTPSKDSFEKMKYGIQIQFDTKESVRTNFQFNGLIPSAYACKCEPEKYFAKDTLKSIRIFTLRNFNSSHPEGSEISEYFKFLKQATTPGRISKISIEESIAQMATSTFTPYDNYQFYLDNIPDTPHSKMEFEIVTEFSNGKILKDTTSQITLD